MRSGSLPSSSRSTRLVPINPALPVTSMVFMVLIKSPPRAAISYLNPENKPFSGLRLNYLELKAGIDRFSGIKVAKNQSKSRIRSVFRIKVKIIKDHRGNTPNDSVYGV